MASRILRLQSVIDFTRLSRSSIYLRMSQGAFPRQVSLGVRAIGSRESGIQTSLDNYE